jgi:lysyl-tRNA synthetase class 2
MRTSGEAQAELRSRLALRAHLRRTVREFFETRGVSEVDTPSLSPAANPDPAIEPLKTVPASLGGRPHYLHTSPEFAMKRLLAAGSGDIFQLCRVYRDHELGRWHEPEFMMLEWYRIGFDEHRLMDEVAELLAACLTPDGPRLPVQRSTYGELCRRELGIDPHGAPEAIVSGVSQLLAARRIDVPDHLSAIASLDLAMATQVVPKLPRQTIVFIHDYPAAQASLAALRPGDPPVAARFEVFVDGIELGNGYRELTDSAEQRARFERDAAKRRAAGNDVPPLDEQLLEALARGLPACAGVALGFDRLVAVAAGARRLADVMDLPHAPPD